MEEEVQRAGNKRRKVVPEELFNKQCTDTACDEDDRKPAAAAERSTRGTDSDDADIKRKPSVKHRKRPRIDSACARKCATQSVEN